MKTKAIILSEMERPRPYVTSRPLTLEDVELDPPGPGEVLVELAAAGLCHSDLSVINGTRAWPLPLVLGHEASGIVREAGPGVTDLKPGDHVVFSFLPVCGRCMECVSGRGWLCERGVVANRAGTLLGGGRRFHRCDGHSLFHHLGVSGFSQHTVAARESLVRIETDVPLEIAVLFGCAVMTGVGAVVNEAKVAPGTSVAIFGLGGVGLSAVLGARVAGAWPIIAVDRIGAKLELARQCGATHFVDASQTDPVAAVKDLSHGGVEAAFEAVGSELVIAQAYSATRRGGKTVAIGLPHPSRHLSLPAASLIAEQRHLMGCYMGSCVPQRDIPRFLNLYKAGLLPVNILKSREIRIDQVNEAFDALDDGEVVRQIIRFN